MRRDSGLGLQPMPRALLTLAIVLATALMPLSVGPAKAQSVEQQRTLDTLERFLPAQKTWTTAVARVPLPSYGLEIVRADGTATAVNWTGGAKVLVLLGPNCPVCLANLRTAVTDVQSAAVRPGIVVIALPDVDATTLTTLVSRGYTVVRPSAFFLESLVLMGASEVPPVVVIANARGEVIRVVRDELPPGRISRALAQTDDFLWEHSGVAEMARLMSSISIGQLPRSVSEAPRAIRFDDYIEELSETGDRSIAENREYGGFLAFDPRRDPRDPVFSRMFGGSSNSVNTHDGILGILREQQSTDQFLHPLLVFHSHPEGSPFSPRDVFLAAYGRKPQLLTHGDGGQNPLYLSLALPTLSSGSDKPFEMTEALVYQYFIRQDSCERMARGQAGFDHPRLLRRMARSLGVALYQGEVWDGVLERIDTSQDTPLDWSLPGFRLTAVEFVQAAAASISLENLRQAFTTPETRAQWNQLYQETPISAEAYADLMTRAHLMGKIDGSFSQMFFEMAPNDAGRSGKGVRIEPAIVGGRCTDDAVVTFFDLANRTPQWGQSFAVSLSGGRLSVTPVQVAGN